MCINVWLTALSVYVYALWHVYLAYVSGEGWRKRLPAARNGNIERGGINEMAGVYYVSCFAWRI